MKSYQEEQIKNFFKCSTKEIAQGLLGKRLIYDSPVGTLSGYIVETEAYLGIEDQACHSYQGKRTPKLESMYQQAGTIYLYTMHTHLMLNLVTENVDDPQGVLIRGIQPVEGIPIMEKNRQNQGILLSNGPGKLTKAFGFTRQLNGQYISNSTLSIDFEQSLKPKEIRTSPRIGIPNKGLWTELPLRYYVAGNPYVSGLKKSLHKKDSFTK